MICLSAVGNNIYLNGVHLTANADSFEIIRWIPHSLLVFRDNNGLHRYPFGQLSGKAIPVDDDVSFEEGKFAFAGVNSSRPTISGASG